MAQFKIIESRPATYYWEYIVEAENETEPPAQILLSLAETAGAAGAFGLIIETGPYVAEQLLASVTVNV